ncbi:hypothetical protein [Micromonospora sp. 067-2]
MTQPGAVGTSALGGILIDHLGAHAAPRALARSPTNIIEEK